jgi:hypothetical protein
LYAAGTVPPEIESELDKALRKDGAHIAWVGNDGSEEYIILEADDFRHTEKLAREKNLKFHFQNKAS